MRDEQHSVIPSCLAITPNIQPSPGLKIGVQKTPAFWFRIAWCHFAKRGGEVDIVMALDLMKLGEVAILSRPPRQTAHEVNLRDADLDQRYF
jgi:hypothetical protein